MLDSHGMQSSISSPTCEKKKLSAGQTFLRRGFSTLILIALLLFVYKMQSAWLYVGLVSLVCVICACEWKMMLKEANIKVSAPFILLINLIYPLFLGAAFLCQNVVVLTPLVVTLIIPAFVLIFAFCWELRKQVEGEKSLLALLGNLLAFLYPTWMFSFGFFLLFLSVQPSGASLELGVRLLFWVLLVTKIMDMGAYISGSLFGKHKMIPHISPNKTWEGFWGACVMTVGAGMGLYLLFFPEGAFQKEILLYGEGFLHLNIWCVGGISLLLGLLSVVGDLAGSFIKRALGVKDSGKLLPGIGGVFDLIDSPAFTLPVMFLLIYLL